MIVVLKPGEEVTIEFFESDGEITVAFDKDAIRVKTDWPDTAGRDGTIYEEIFTTFDDEDCHEKMEIVHA